MDKKKTHDSSGTRGDQSENKGDDKDGIKQSIPPIGERGEFMGMLNGDASGEEIEAYGRRICEMIDAINESEGDEAELEEGGRKRLTFQPKLRRGQVQQNRFPGIREPV